MIFSNIQYKLANHLVQRIKQITDAGYSEETSYKVMKLVLGYYIPTSYAEKEDKVNREWDDILLVKITTSTCFDVDIFEGEVRDLQNVVFVEGDTRFVQMNDINEVVFDVTRTQIVLGRLRREAYYWYLVKYDPDMVSRPERFTREMEIFRKFQGNIRGMLPYKDQAFVGELPTKFTESTVPDELNLEDL